MVVSPVETDASQSVQYSDGQPTCSGQILTPEESIALDRWWYGPDVPPDPQFDLGQPAIEVVLRWAARHGLLLYKGLPGDKHPMKHHPWGKGCQDLNREGKCRCWVMWDGKGPALIRVPRHMGVLDEDGPEAAVLTDSMKLPPHFAIRSRTSGGIKRFGFVAGGVRRAIRIRPDFDLIGNPDGKCVWVKIWDDTGYDVIGESDAVPEWPESVISLAAPAGGRRRRKKRRGRSSAIANGSGDLPPTGKLVADGIPVGRQDDWLTRVAAREARAQWEARHVFDEDQITATLARIALASEQDDSDRWTLEQLREKAQSAIRFITNQAETEPAVQQDAQVKVAAASPDGDAVTDSHFAPRFVMEALRGRYCWAKGLGWMAWRGDSWSSAPDEEIGELARAWVLREYEAFLAEASEVSAAQLKQWLKQLSQYHVKAVVTLAKGIVLCDAAEFDAYPDLLNCRNCVVDLRTGEQIGHDPALMLTKTTGTRYVPGATHPDWDKALTALPAEVRQWYQIRIGQGATGHMPPDDAVLVNQGGGENGKTTVLQGIRHALGDYYVQVPAKALYGDPGQHDTVMMPFRGARIAALEETPEEGRLNMQQVKAITTPQIRGRLMRQDYIEFDTTHATLVNTNPEPVVENADHGTWRRLILVKYPYTFLKRGQERKLPSHREGDPGLRDRIIAGEQGQHEAALAWMVKGARAWYEAGRVMPQLPERVQADTEEWRGRANLVYGFAEEYLEPSADHHIIADELYQFFDHTIKASGHRSWAKETLFKRLREHATATGWGIDKKMTRRRMDRLSRPPDEFLMPPKDSCQAWHGLRFKAEPVWHEEADSRVSSHAEKDDQSRSAYEHSLVSGVSGPSVPLSACAREEGTDPDETPETSQVRGV